MKRPTSHQQRHRHPRRANHQQRLAAQAIHQPDGHEGHSQIDQSHQHRLPEFGVDASARLHEDGGQIIENGVDAGDLLEERNHQRNTNDKAHLSAKQSAHPDARCSLGKTLPDVAHFIFRLFHAASFDQNLFGALLLPFAKQPARAFRHGKKKEEIKCRRNGIHSQHPAPIIFPDIEQKIIGEKGRRNAEDDHELIERDQTPAPFRRCDFRDINRRDKNRSADRHSAENPGDDENSKMSCEREEKSRTDKKNSRGDQDFLSSKTVAEKSRHGSTSQDAPAKTAHQKAKQKITAISIQAKVFLNERHSAGNDRGIKSPNKTTQRDDQGDQHYVFFPLLHIYFGSVY